ncbi:hypothetical protein EB837_12370 [Kluyvera ascorbata]|uniref:Uncharacterized protein n=1 Tax=Kluyvera ascorbata TaxID=51288 RepID=A0A3N2S215_9ENTR|nr:hypothetical protein [Kluyvera ascorbata]ROU13714.1 hypothetical protein EB837_12370 [Kluyvera ascorbata]
MNDITALMQRLVLAAAKGCCQTLLPDDCRALVEALEKAQNTAAQQGNIACALFDEITAQRQRIAELESRTVTVKLPPEVMRKAQAPQHLSKHDQLCWMSGANWMRMEVVKLNPVAGIQVIEGDGQ